MVRQHDQKSIPNKTSDYSLRRSTEDSDPIGLLWTINMPRKYEQKVGGF